MNLPQKEFSQVDLWPRLGRVFGFEFGAWVGAVSMAGLLLLANIPVLMNKVRFTEVLTLAFNGKMELVERLALSGELVERQAGGSDVQMPSVEIALAGQTSRRAASRQDEGGEEGRAARKGAEGDRGDRQGGSGKYVSSMRIVGNTIVVAGSLAGPYELGIYPSVIDDDVTGTFVWVCGRGRAPAGWIAETPAVTSNLPNRLLPFQCRGRKAQ